GFGGRSTGWRGGMWTCSWSGFGDGGATLPMGWGGRTGGGTPWGVRGGGAGLLAERYREGGEELKLLDLERSIRPDWFQDPATIGYVCYADRFAGTLEGVGDHLDYLGELGVRYLHLMPLLAPREGDSDGGYAVRDYRAVDPPLGTMEGLERLCGLARRGGISVCVALVLNHCAAEHQWALAARAGDPEAEAMFWVFPD